MNVDVNTNQLVKGLNLDSLLATSDTVPICLSNKSKENAHVSKNIDNDDRCESRTGNQYLVVTDKCDRQCIEHSTVEVDECAQRSQRAVSSNSILSSMNNDQTLRKNSQETSVSSKENVNPSFNKSDSSPVEKTSNWRQDNWNSIHCEGKAATDDDNFKIKNIKSKKSKALSSLFGDDSCDNEVISYETEVPCRKDEDSHIARDKKSNSKSRESVSKKSLNAVHIDSISSEGIGLSPPLLLKGCDTLKYEEQFPKEEIDDTTLPQTFCSVIENDSTTKSVGIGRKSKHNHHEVHVKSIDLFSNTNPADKNKIQERKPPLDLYSLFGDKTETEGVKSKSKSSKHGTESSHSTKKSVSKDRRHDQGKAASCKDKSHKDKYEGSEDSYKNDSNMSEDNDFMTRHSQHLVLDSKDKSHKDHKDKHKGNTSSEGSDRSEYSKSGDKDLIRNHPQPLAMGNSKSKESHTNVVAKKHASLEVNVPHMENAKLIEAKFKQNWLLGSKSSHDKTKGKKIPLEAAADDEGTVKKGHSMVSDLFGDITDICSTDSSDTGMKNVEQQEKFGLEGKNDWMECIKSFGKFYKEYGDIGNVAKKCKQIQEEKPKHQISEYDVVQIEKKNYKRGGLADIKINHEFKMQKNQEIAVTKDTEKLDCLKPIETKSSALASSSKQKAAPGDTKRDDLRPKPQKSSLEVKVVEEVKKWLDPYYRDKSVTKDEYKQIVAKCVKKVVTAECGDIIESEKMRGLVDGYVVLYKHRRTKLQQSSAN